MNPDDFKHKCLQFKRLTKQICQNLHIAHGHMNSVSYNNAGHNHSKGIVFSYCDAIFCNNMHEAEAGNLTGEPVM